MALDEIREEITRKAAAVHDAAERLKEGIETQRVSQQLEGELDILFAELGVEVYQRVQRDDPVETSVVVQDMVDRIAEVEMRLEAAREHA